MTKRYFSLGVLALVVLGSTALQADPLMTSLQIGPQAPDPIARGGSASYVVTITRTNNGDMGIFLSIPDLPPGASASFSPNPINIPPQLNTGTATLTISTTGAIAPGPTPFSVVARDGRSHNSRTNTATLDVTMTSPGLARLSDGTWCFAFATEPGTTYSIQATTNCWAPNWTTLCTTNSGTNNLLVFVHRDMATCPSRFYRSVPE